MVVRIFVEAALWRDDSGKLFVRETSDIISGRAGLRGIDGRPAPLDKHPTTLSDQCTARPSRRHSSRYRVYDLSFASIVVIRHLPCQDLYVVMYSRIYMPERCHKPAASHCRMNTHRCVWLV